MGEITPGGCGGGCWNPSRPCGEENEEEAWEKKKEHLLALIAAFFFAFFFSLGHSKNRRVHNQRALLMRTLMFWMLRN